MDFEVASESVKAQTTDIRSEAQELTPEFAEQSRLESEFQAEPENGANPRNIAVDLTVIQPSIQLPQIEPEIPGETGAVSELAQIQKVESKIQTIDTQPSIQRAEAEAELSTNMKVGMSATSLENHVAETQSSVQEVGTGFHN